MKVSTLTAVALGFSLALGATPLLAEDLTFTLINNSTRDLHVFQTSPAGVDSWEDDVLGSDVLSAGASVSITIADGRDACVYDMRFEMEDGTELEDYDVDLCALGSYELHDE